MRLNVFLVLLTGFSAEAKAAPNVMPEFKGFDAVTTARQQKPRRKTKDGGTTLPFIEPMLGYAFGGLPSEGGSFDAVNVKGPRGEFRAGAMFSDWFVLSARAGLGFYTSSSIGIDTQSGQHIDLAQSNSTVINPSIGADLGARVAFDSLVSWIWIGLSPMNLYRVPATVLTEQKTLTSRSLSLTVEYEVTRRFNFVASLRFDSRSGVPAASSWSFGLGMPIQIGRDLNPASTPERGSISGVPGVGTGKPGI